MAFWMRRDKSTRTTEILWRKRDDMAALSVKERAGPLPGQAFIGFNLHRDTGCNIHKAHQSLSGRNDQTTDNIQRTLRAYSESGSVS